VSADIFSEYRKRPIVIDAARWDGTVETATPIIDWVLDNGGTARYRECCTSHDGRLSACVPGIAIATLEGTITARPGDWVLRDSGGFYPCKPEIFAATYEPA
jgi:hypothetical protein